MNLTYYDILGVDEHSSAVEIKHAYRQASLKFHPDRDGGNHRQFNAITTAYQTLADPERRSAYDRDLAHPASTGPAAPSDPPTADASTAWGGEDFPWTDDFPSACETRADTDWAVDSDWGSDADWMPEPPQPRPPTPHPSDIDAAAVAQRRQARLVKRARRISRRRSHDHAVFVAAVALCITIVVPWFFGRSQLRDTFLHPKDPAVYDITVRTGLRYLAADWSAGCLCILAAAALFVLVRPWSGRRLPVVFAWVAVAALLSLLLPYTLAEWKRQEAVSASHLRNTVYPFDQRYQSCGQATASFGSSPVETGKPDVVYTLYSSEYQTAGTKPSGSICNGFELWQGHRRVKQVTLAGRGKQVEIKAITVNHTGEVKTTVYSVKLASGATLRYPLSQLLALK